MTFGPWRTAGALLLMALTAGCHTPGYNSYSTARTIPPGGVSAALHVQATGHSGEVDGERNPDVALFPPGVSGRLGLTERLDAGAHLGISPFAGSAIGADLKWLVLPGEALDLAFDPGFELSHLQRPDIGFGREEDPNASVEFERDFWQLRVPILVGVNLSRRVAVILTTGVVYGWPSPDGWLAPERERARLVDGAAPLVGLGLNLRAGYHVAFHPEATFVFSRADNQRRTIYTLGFAIQFGRLPRIFRGEKPPPRPGDEHG